EMFTADARPEIIDHAQAMVDRLPELADCTDTATLPVAPPAALAAQIAPLEAELRVANTRAASGELEPPRKLLVAPAERADATVWAPLTRRAPLGLGEVLVEMDLPAGEELTRAGELATANHLDRDAVRAWGYAMQAASRDNLPDTVAALAATTRGAA